MTYKETHTKTGLARTIPSYSLPVILVFFALISMGTANLYSATGEDLFYTSLRHIGLGLCCFFICGWIIPLKATQTYTPFFFWLTVASLGLVLALGYTAGGAQRWINLGAIRFQPSEFAKLAIALITAKFFAHRRPQHSYTVTEILPLLALLLGVFALIFKQPDFGTAGICLLIGLTQLAFLRIRISLTLATYLSLGGAVTAAVGWFFLLRPYQKLRILTLLNPDQDPTGSGYNSLQSLIAIGSGSIWGKGYLQGTQSQFLPARQTDFIFAVFAEEQGFWGCLCLFFLFSILAYLAIGIARTARDPFASILAIGVGALIFVEFTINIAMVLGIFPVVGMPLPFFSYGGSSLLTVCAACGLLIAIDRQNSKMGDNPYFH